jgi:predicted amidophosphoribosyltransferase
MRIDSCRKCGEELQITRLCSNCVQPLHFDCNNCNVFVDDPIPQHENSLESFLLGPQDGKNTLNPERSMLD